METTPMFVIKRLNADGNYWLHAEQKNFTPNIDDAFKWTNYEGAQAHLAALEEGAYQVDKVFFKSK